MIVLQLQSIRLMVLLSRFLIVYAALQHFGIDKKRIRYTQRDFLVPIGTEIENDREEKSMIIGKSVDRFEKPFAANGMQNIEPRGYKCAVCDAEYMGAELPSQEMVIDHLRICVAPLREFCAKYKIRAFHKPTYGT